MRILYVSFLIFFCFYSLSFASPSEVASTGICSWVHPKSSRAYFYIDPDPNPVLSYTPYASGVSASYNLKMVHDINKTKTDVIFSAYHEPMFFKYENAPKCGSLQQEMRPGYPCWVSDPDNPDYYKTPIYEKKFTEYQSNLGYTCLETTPGNCSSIPSLPTPDCKPNLSYLKPKGSYEGYVCRSLNTHYSQTYCVISAYPTNMVDPSNCQLGVTGYSYVNFQYYINMAQISYYLLSPTGSYNPPVKTIPPSPNPPTVEKSKKELSDLLLSNQSSFPLPDVVLPKDPAVPSPLDWQYNFKSDAFINIRSMFMNRIQTFFDDIKTLKITDLQLDALSGDSSFSFDVFGHSVNVDFDNYRFMFSVFRDLVYFLVAYSSFRIIFYRM